jgi:GT2 family glycosyltransferase
MRVTVVIATRNRPAELARTLSHLAALRPAPPTIVVDNASDEGVDWLYGHPCAPEVIRLRRNRGAQARTVGVRHARTPYVAFSDDDSWWAPGALGLASDALDRHPGLGLVAGRILIGPERVPDPANLAIAQSPLSGPGHLPGRPVLGCLACGTVVRRTAYLGVGGFPGMFGVGGEETLLCYDLAAAGWAVRYVEQVAAHHYPATTRPPTWRRQALQRRNAALVGWMRRPLPVALADTWHLARTAGRDRVARAALAGLIRALPAALADRCPLPVAVERQVRLLERAG